MIAVVVAMLLEDQDTSPSLLERLDVKNDGRVKFSMIVLEDSPMDINTQARRQHRRSATIRRTMDGKVAVACSLRCPTRSTRSTRFPGSPRASAKLVSVLENGTAKKASKC